MKDVVWLDHDFAHEHVPDPPGLMRVGTVLDIDVFCVDDLDAVRGCAASDGATGDPGPRPSGSGSPALAAERAKAQLIAQLLELLTPKPSQWHSFFLTFTRRARVDGLEELPVEVLHTVVEQAHTLHLARGGR